MAKKILPTGMPAGKRVFDLIATVSLILLLSPVFLVVAILLMAINGRPLFFKQKRPGHKGEIFTLYKFRTMSRSVDSNGDLLSDAERLSSFGKFLRATSIDELPELFNVLKGDMSLVGPRPLLIEYLALYTPEQDRRHDVLPGITGWAQINGRNTLSWEEKFKLDVWYVDNWSFCFDMKIFFLTFWKVIIREGISQPGSATTEYFKGSNKENN